MSISKETKFQAARAWAVQRRPYFATALFACGFRFVPGFDSFAVTANGTLLLGEVAMERETVQEIGTSLIHEVEHLIRAHATRRGDRDAHLWNMACDFEINDGIDMPGSDLLLPPDFCPTPAKQRAVSKLPDAATVYADGLTAEHYFAALLREQPPRGAGRGGNCGSGAGNPSPHEQPHEQQPRPASSKPGDGDGQGEGGLTEAELASVRSAVALAVAAEAVAQRNNPGRKARGNLPAGLVRWAEERVAPPKVRWQDKVRRLAAMRTAEIITGKVDTSFARPSRRQHLAPAGVVLRGAVGYAPLVAFVQDTSGSMSDTELKAGAAELEGIARTLQGARLHYLSADARVCASGRIRGWRDVVRGGLVKGGGGTDFRPAFDALAALPGGAPDLIVFHTDGYGRFPAAPPKRTKVIWVSTQAGPEHYPWGDVVCVPPDSQRGAV